MLTIKDLAVSKSLDSKEMTAVRGGFNAASASSYIGEQTVLGAGNKGPVVGVQANSVVQTQSQFDIHPKTELNFGGFGFPRAY